MSAPEERMSEQEQRDQGQNGKVGLLERYDQSLLGVFGPPSLVLVEGRGCEVTDAAGRTYLDLLGGIAVNSIGHAHPAWTRAISEQAGRLGHISNFFTSPQQIALAERLLGLIDPAGAVRGTGRAFFTNSGTEAVEAALKLVRAHGNRAEPRRGRILALHQGFHGRTAGALAATWKPAYREPFEPLPGGVEFIEPTLEALAAAVDDSVAGLIVEPIQGEAGVHPLPQGFLRRARQLTRKHGALLIVDEVQSGVGRTGMWFEHQRELGPEDLPDAVTLAKGLGGGFPVGAMLCLTEQAVAGLAPGSHGTTFGGNPLATTAALATLDVIEREELPAHAETLGARLRERLAEVPGVAAVRGRGLLIGFDLEADDGAAPRAVTEARWRGFLINATGPRTLRLAPPLILTAEQAETFLDALPEILAAAAEEKSGAGDAPAQSATAPNHTAQKATAQNRDEGSPR